MNARSYSLITRLATHLQRPVDLATRDRARLHLLDWLACVAGARESGLAQAVRGVARGYRFLGNLLEMDDVHRTALLHPGPVIWPAVFCQAGQAPGLNPLLDAAARGYEAMIALGETLDAAHYAHWHPTATTGGFGAAAAAASLLGLDAEATGWALGNAASVAGGFWHMRHGTSMAKQWHLDHAVRTGLAAAANAAAGLTGPVEVLEGAQGLFAGFGVAPRPMNFRDGWRIHQVSFKPWAACRHAHPVIDCALELRAAGRLQPPFMVETYADALAFCDRPDPTTPAEAKFSLQHAVAVIAAGRDARPADFTEAAIAQLAPLRAQVKVAEAAGITARYPAHFGARLNGHELIDTRGDPERPVDADAIHMKLAMLVEWGGLPPAEADRATVLALEGDDPHAITAMLDAWLA